MNSTPASLLQRLRIPCESTAWDRFVELYSPLLFVWAQRLGLQDSDAGDLVQDVFAILVRELPDFEYDSQKCFRAWLKTVFLNQYRKRGRGKAFPAQNSDLNNFAASDEVELMEEREYRQFLIHRTLALIEHEYSPVLWRAFREYALAGRDPGDIANELGISAGTVYAIKSKVMRRLRQELQQFVD